MTAVYPVFYDAALTVPDAPPEVTVSRYTWHALGGPETATLRASGTPERLWRLVERLGRPVKIFDGTAAAVWWGYVSGVTVRIAALTLGVSLDAMSNAVAVQYSDSAGNDRTDWATHARSVAAYGTKERLDSLSGSGSAAAAAKRDALLAQYALPAPTVDLAPGGASLEAELECRGWWSTLAWRYYNCADGRVGYTDLGNGIQVLGDSAAKTYVAQSFASAIGMYVSKIKIQARTAGAPTDNLRVALYTESGGAPAASLGFVDLAAATLPGNMTWVTATFAAPVWIAPGTYWVVVSRTGALNTTNYYSVNVNEELGAAGVLRIYNGSAWTARSPDADLNFEVYGSKYTDDTLGDIVMAAGQFLPGGLRFDADYGGIWGEIYRRGDATALDEFKRLLEVGTPALRRLLATVTEARALRVYVEPVYDPRAPKFYVGIDGQVTDRHGRRVTHTCPVGDWAQLREVLPPNWDTSRLADVSGVFIERAEYAPETDTLRIEPRAPSAAWDVGGIEAG